MSRAASNLQIDSARLWDTIHETAKFGATPKGGVRRLTLGPEDKQVRDWFRHYLVEGKKGLPPLPKVRAGR